MLGVYLSKINGLTLCVSDYLQHSSRLPLLGVNTSLAQGAEDESDTAPWLAVGPLIFQPLDCMPCVRAFACTYDCVQKVGRQHAKVPPISAANIKKGSVPNIKQQVKLA